MRKMALNGATPGFETRFAPSTFGASGAFGPFGACGAFGAGGPNQNTSRIRILYKLLYPLLFHFYFTSLPPLLLYFFIFTTYTVFHLRCMMTRLWDM